MNHRSWTAFIAAICFVLTSSIASFAATPNVVIFFIDDMGYADIGPFGCTRYETPNIDAMAKAGRKMTNFLVSSAVCSASRAALMTGCYHERVGIRGALDHRAQIGIAANETTIAELCKSKGYSTAIFGKWHLGHHPKYLPTQHGFDAYLGLPYSNDMWPGTVAKRANIPEDQWRYPRLPLIQNDRVIDEDVVDEDQTTLTKRYTEAAIQFIEKNKDKPFFIYIPHSMVHVPIYASEDFQNSSGKGIYADVVGEVDWSVGQVRATLKKLNLEQNTLVVFTSDNGPWLSYGDHGGSAGTLREGKGTSFEGGVRVPAIFCMPGAIPADTVTRTLGCTVDILPTVAELIGADLPKNKIDGKSLVDVLKGEVNQPSHHDSVPIYYANGQLQAIRTDDFKLVFPHQYRSMKKDSQGYGIGGKDGEPAEYATLKLESEQLFDMRSDAGETHDISQEHPAELARLRGYAEKWRAELGDSLTKKNGSEIRPADALKPDDVKLVW